MTVPTLWIAAVVRPHHANTFVEEWLRVSWESGALTDAFGETHLMKWPQNAGDGGKESPEERRYNDIEDEILERMLDTLRSAILAAFTSAATEVLAREKPPPLMSSSELRFARAVTGKHGETFADEWFRASPFDAIDATGIMRWPDDRPAQLRYHEIEDEICGRTFEAVKDAIAEAFVRVAGEVLDRERAAQRRR